MIYLYLFGTCFHFIYVFMIIGNKNKNALMIINCFLQKCEKSYRLMLFHTLSEEVKSTDL